MNECRWFVYFLECETGRIYTGITPDLANRMRTHKRGRGALFTRINAPERLLGVKPFGTRREAQQMEVQIKRLRAQQKRYLAALWSQQYVIDEFAQKALALN